MNDSFLLITKNNAKKNINDKIAFSSFCQTNYSHVEWMALKRAGLLNEDSEYCIRFNKVYPEQTLFKNIYQKTRPVQS